MEIEYIAKVKALAERSYKSAFLTIYGAWGELLNIQSNTTSSWSVLF